MEPCVVEDCPGHDDWRQVLVHGQQHLIGRVRDVQQQLNRIQLIEESVMADIDQLTADFQQFQSDVTTAVDELKTELANALANQGGIPQAVQAKLDALDAAVQSADESLATPPAPAPGPTPTPGT